MDTVIIEDLRGVRVPRELRDRVKTAARAAGQTIQGFTILALEAELRRRVTVEPAEAAATQQNANLGH